MIRVGDKLVVGWADIYAVDIATREATSLGQATIFVPAAEPNRVWMIRYPGGRIGLGQPRVWQVDVVSGEPLTEPRTLPTDGLPQTGIQGGLALATDTGLNLWDMESGQITSLEGDGPGFVSDVDGEELAWCSGECSRLVVTNTTTFESNEFEPLRYKAFLHRSGAFSDPNQVSPSSRYLAALVGLVDGDNAIWILDRETGNTTLVSHPGTYVGYLAWAPDGDQLFATSWSSRQPVTVIWRYQIADQEFTAVVLPFGGTLSPVVVDRSVIDAYIGGDPVDISQCVVLRVQPGGRSGCTFGY